MAARVEADMEVAKVEVEVAVAAGEMTASFLKSESSLVHHTLSLRPSCRRLKKREEADNKGGGSIWADSGSESRSPSPAT